jgi:hypothetical protein
VVFVVEGTAKGTIRSAQEYSEPLFVLSGVEYASVPFAALHARVCDTLRGNQPCLVAEVMLPDGTLRLFFDNDSSRHNDSYQPDVALAVLNTAFS